MSAPKKTVSFPPPPTTSVLRQIPSEDGTVQEDPGVQFNRHLKFKAWVMAWVKDEVKDVFRKALADPFTILNL